MVLMISLARPCVILDGPFQPGLPFPEETDRNEVKRLSEPPRLWEMLVAACATIITIVVAAVSATWVFGRSVSDTALRISEVELKVSQVELAVTTAIKDSDIRTLELLAEMRKENQLAHDKARGARYRSAGRHCRVCGREISCGHRKVRLDISLDDPPRSMRGTTPSGG